MPAEPSPDSPAESAFLRPPTGGKRTLKQKAMRGSAITFVGFGGTQFIRLAGNILVARLLAPEDFGLMAIVWVVMFTVTMLSDVGAGPAVVRHERGDEPNFLNTAWTMQVIRGIVMFLGACLIAWPVAYIYKEPRLVALIIVVASTALFDGFVTMKMYTATRHLALGRQTLVELLSQTAGVFVMVGLAIAYNSVWSLVAGAITARLLRLVIAEIILPGVSNRFCWEREAVGELFRFGRWIFLSSLLMLVGKQADKPLLGFLDSMAILGIYERANRLGDPFQSLTMQLARKVVFPAMSSVHRDRPEELRRNYYRARLALDGVFLPLLGALIISAPIFVSILYDDRYEAAGWMLQLLLVRVTMQCMLDPSGECLIAINKPQYGFWWTLSRTVWILVGLPLGWYYFGLLGVVCVVGFSEVPVMIVIWHGMIRYKLLNFSRELLAVSLVLMGMVVGWGFTFLWDAALVEHWLHFEAWLRALWESRSSG